MLVCWADDDAGAEDFDDEAGGASGSVLGVLLDAASGDVGAAGVEVAEVVVSPWASFPPRFSQPSTMDVMMSRPRQKPRSDDVEFKKAMGCSFLLVSGLAIYIKSEN